MKKHLLAALLVVGAMSYADVVVIPGGAGSANLKVEAKGILVHATDITLVIRATTEATTTGDFDFDFGVVSGNIITKTGNFESIITKNGAVVPFTKVPDVKLTQNGGDTTGNATSLIDGIGLTYVMNVEPSSILAGSEKVEGTLRVDVDATGATGGVGTFKDNSVGIKVTVNGQV